MRKKMRLRVATFRLSFDVARCCEQIFSGETYLHLLVRSFQKPSADLFSFYSMKQRKMHS